MAKTQRKQADHLSVTVRIHAVHDTEQNTRIMHACVQQRAVANRTVEHLLKHRSDEPLHKNTRLGVTGLYGHWPAWRAENEGLANVASLVARGGIAAAADQVAKWEATNHEHAVLVAKAQDDGKPIPRRVQRRSANTSQLWRHRKQEERDGRHRCRIDEQVRLIDKRTLQVPGIGPIRTKDDIPENLDIRSCVVLERTPSVRRQQKLKAAERSFKVHISGRRPKPPLKGPHGTGRAVGIDHGIVHAMTVIDQEGNIETFDHDIEQARRADRRIKNLGRRTARCKPKSRTWQRLQAVKQGVRRKLDNARRHRRRGWANRLVHANDTVCVEALNARNMTRNARGTNEAPGAKIKAKTGLNRSLLGIAPAEQTTILLRSGERVGTRIELVPAAGTSQTCNACSCRHAKNRENQARFRCTSCGHTDNADANAARNVRDRGVATIRARMDASWTAGRQPSEGANASRKSDGQEQSRPHATPRPPERAPDPGGTRGFSTPTRTRRGRNRVGRVDCKPRGRLRFDRGLGNTDACRAPSTRKSDGKPLTADLEFAAAA